MFRRRNQQPEAPATVPESFRIYPVHLGRIESLAKREDEHSWPVALYYPTGGNPIYDGKISQGGLDYLRKQLRPGAVIADVYWVSLDPAGPLTADEVADRCDNLITPSSHYPVADSFPQGSGMSRNAARDMLQMARLLMQ